MAIAANGEEGLAEVAKQAPDLIILDIMMPGIDGIETCRRIRADPATADHPGAHVQRAVRATRTWNGPGWWGPTT